VFSYAAVVGPPALADRHEPQRDRKHDDRGEEDPLVDDKSHGHDSRPAPSS